MKGNNAKKNVKKVFMAILLILFIIYAIVVIYRLIKSPSKTFLVENGKLYFEENATGYIIRDETIVEGKNLKNGIAPIKSEGEKIAKGESIFRYYTNNEEDLKGKIKELDEKIQEAMRKENNLFSSDIKLLDNQIEEKLVDIYNQNDIQKIKEYKKDINSYITKKAKISGEKSPAGSYIKNLINERSGYENQLNSSAEYVTASKAGVLSYRIDGLEEVLRPDDFSKLNKEFLDNLNLKTSQIIGTSDEKGKIIDNFKCYIACSIDSEKAREAKIGDYLKIRLPNNKEVPVTIVYANTEESNNVILVFEIENYVEELISYRKIAFDIIWWSDTGLKLPNSAIMQDENISYIIRNRAGYLEKIYVKVLRKNDNFSVVSNYESSELQELGFDTKEIQNRSLVSLYDEIILEPSEEKIKQAR